MSRLLHADLDVVCSWQYPTTVGWSGYGYVPAPYDPRGDAEKAATAVVDAVCGPERPPELTLEVREGHAAHVLCECSGDAELLVVGSRGARRVRGSPARLGQRLRRRARELPGGRRARRARHRDGRGVSTVPDDRARASRPVDGPRSRPIAAVVTGHAASDALARHWARRRAEQGGVRCELLAPDDLDLDAHTVLVVGRGTGPERSADAQLAIDLAARCNVPVVSVTTHEPPLPVTELADTPRLPVVVGVPTASGATEVLDVAVPEALARGTDLLVSRLWRESDWLTSMRRADVEAMRTSRTEDRRRLDDAVLHAHHHHPDLDVRAELLDGNVYDWLRDLGHRAAMVVLGAGADGHGELTRWALLHVAAPVVIVPHRPAHGATGRRGARRPRAAREQLTS